MESFCANCSFARECLLTHFGSQSGKFSAQTLNASALQHSSSTCAFCSFLSRASGLTNAAVKPDTALHVRADKHGTIYITGPASRESKTTYLLPLESSQNGLIGRKINADFDFDLLRTWLSRCEQWHGKNCYTPGWNEVLPQAPRNVLRLIDVNQRCLVSAPPSTRYIALSYVWGDTKVLKTTRQNIDALSRPGSLTSSNLPRTIADAIVLVEKIGEGFLWVDSLCILQDDHDDKHQQINDMDSIYGNAALTINAAAGRNAEAGLPGVRPLTRQIESITVRLSPEWSLTCGQPALQEKCDQTYWNTRGWTYQERFLSKRSVTFMEDAIFFQCQRMLWCEDVHAEREDVHDYYQMDDYLPVIWSTAKNPHMYKLHYALHVHDSTNWTEYLRVVEEYTTRQLSDDADSLNAFAGMSSVLGRTFASNMLVGLPESLIDCALLWQPAEPLTKRLSKDGDPLFPSWSWAAWKGEIVHEDITPYFKILSHDLIRCTKPLCVWWQRHDSDGSLESVASVGQPGTFILEQFENRLPAGWHISDEQSVDIFSDLSFYHEDSPKRLFAVPTDNHLKTLPLALQWVQLECKTQVAWVRIEQNSDSGNDLEEPSLCRICHGTGQWIGTSHFDDGSVVFEPASYPIALLSEGELILTEAERLRLPKNWTVIQKDKDYLYSFYNVMILDTLGVKSQRLGVGKISKGAWDSLAPIYADVILT